jgi:hypothetical protein
VGRNPKEASSRGRDCRCTRDPGSTPHVATPPFAAHGCPQRGQLSPGGRRSARSLAPGEGSGVVGHMVFCPASSPGSTSSQDWAQQGRPDLASLAARPVIGLAARSNAAAPGTCSCRRLFVPSASPRAEPRTCALPVAAPRRGWRCRNRRPDRSQRRDRSRTRCADR